VKFLEYLADWAGVLQAEIESGCMFSECILVDIQ
jgi:hypothetical protein